MHATSPVVYDDAPGLIGPSCSFPDSPLLDSDTEDAQATLAGDSDDCPITRETAEFRSLYADSGEAFGQIVPETAADFLELIEKEMGCSEHIAISPSGRVLLATGYVGPAEAMAIGQVVARHILSPDRREVEIGTKIAIEKRGGCFKAVLIDPLGDRTEAPGVTTSEADARHWGRVALINLRSTIA